MRKFTLLIAMAFVLGLTAKSQFKWINIYNTSDGTSLTAADFLDEDNGVAVGTGGTIIKTTDGGESWEVLDSSFDIDLEGVDYVEEGVIVAVGYSGTIIRTTDGGVTWTNVEHAAGNLILFDVDIDGASGGGLITGMGHLIMWTDDAGITWEVVGNPGHMNNYYGCFMNDDGFGIVVGKNAAMEPLISYTDDGNGSWNYPAMCPLINNSCTSATAYDAYFFNSDDGYIAGTTFLGTGFITIESDWSSTQWEAIELPSTLKTIDFANDSYGVTAGYDYIKQEGYMAETNDGGVTWDEAVMVSGQSTGGYQDIVAFENTGYAVTSDGEIFKRINTTSLNDQYGTIKNMHIAPNPVTEGTTILRLGMSQRSDVTVNIMDITGQKVRQSIVKELPEGEQQITLNTMGLKTGVYLVSVNTSAESYIKKMVIK